MKRILLLVFMTATASADPAPHAILVHVPPLAAEVGQPIALEAMIDAPYAEGILVRWRPIGTREWHDTSFARSSAGGWYAMLPPAEAPGVEYYIRGTDQQGAEVDHFASAEAPHVVAVEPSEEDRLEAMDRARLHGLANEVSLDVIGHDFGNRYDLEDRFVRGEVVYTHHLLRFLHDVGFGFGTISGHTPLMSAPDAGDVRHALRYGFGQAQLRLTPSVFVDGRIGMGVSDKGFEQNVRGAITFGKPWRSSLQLGAEYLGDLGPTAWVRLQWDTAPPLLMGASVVRSDLPGAVLSRYGLYVAYDVAYRVLDRVSVKAQVSYGSRDGAAHFGGGLGTAVAF